MDKFNMEFGVENYTNFNNDNDNELKLLTKNISNIKQAYNIHN